MDYADYEDLPDPELKAACERGDVTALAVAAVKDAAWITDSIRLAVAKELLREAQGRLYTVEGAAATHAAIDNFFATMR